MTEFLSKKARGIAPYAAGEQPRGKSIVKLNTNESPYGPSPRVLAAVKAAADQDLRKYPDASGGAFRLQAAEYIGVSPENIFCGNGSDEVLAFAFQAFFDPGLPVLSPDISYSFYPVWAALFDIQLKRIPLDKDFTVHPSDYFGAPGGVVLANPNAPTGIALPKKDIEAIITKNPDRVVIIDEAYVEFGAKSVAELIRTCPNLLVVRTLSKSQSLAGMRAGFAAGDAALIDGLVRIKDSFNSYPINRLTEAASAAALADTEYYQRENQRIIETREWTSAELTKRGFTVLPSKANFLFAGPSGISAGELFLALREQNIFVRWFDAPRIRDFCRISIGTDGEMRALLDAVDAILE